MKKKRILGLALAAVMVIGSSVAVMADDPALQSGEFSFDKVYQLNGGSEDTDPSPAETFYFVSADNQKNQASLYAVASTSYNGTSDVDTLKTLEELPPEQKNKIPENVKTVQIGTAGYDAGAADEAGASRAVAVTPPEADNYGSVGYYYYKFTEKEGNTQGVTYNNAENLVRVAVTADEDGQKKISSVKLFDAAANAKKTDVRNYYGVGTIKIIKNVTGNMGNRDQEFDVMVTFTAQDNKLIKAPITVKTSDDTLNNPKTLNPKADGDRELEIKLKVKDKTVVEFDNLPEGVTYTVKETGAADYEAPKYQRNEEKDTKYGDEGISGTVKEGKDDQITIVNRKHNEGVDTGVFTSNLPYIIILAGAAAGLVLFFAGKKRGMKED